MTGKQIELAFDIIKVEGFPPRRRLGLPILNIQELVKLSEKTRISVSKIAFYFTDMKQI